MSNSSIGSSSNRESLDSFKTPDINNGDRLDILRRANDEPTSYPTPPSESLTNDDDGSNSCSDENLYNMTRFAMANYPVNQFRSEFEIKNLLASARPPLLPIISPSNSVTNLHKMEQYLQSQYDLQTCKNDAIKFPITNICQIPPPDLASIEAAEANNRMNQSKRRTRTKFTKQQLDILEATFEKTHYPDVNVVDRLSDVLKLATERISIWFQNRRARYKKIKKNEPTTRHHIESRESLNSSITSNSNGYCDSSESGSFTHVVPHERGGGGVATRYNNNNNNNRSSRRLVKQEPKLDLDDDVDTEEEDEETVDKIKEADSNENQNQFKFETLQQQYDATTIACKSPLVDTSSTTTTTDTNNQTTATTTSAQSPSNNETYSDDEDDKESVISSQQQMPRSASSLSIKTGADSFYNNPFLQGFYPSSNGLLSLAGISQQQQNQIQNAYPGYNFPTTSTQHPSAFQSPYMPFPYYQNYQNPPINTNAPSSTNTYNSYTHNQHPQSFHPGLFQPYAAASTAIANYPPSTLDTYNIDNQTYSSYNYQLQQQQQQQPAPVVAYTD